MEQLTNGLQTTLSASITSSDVTMTVPGAAAAAPWPTTGKMRVIIGSEIIYVTAGLGSTTWNIDRAQEGSSAAAHASGDTIYQVLTAAGVASALAEVVQFGTLASLPTVARVGTRYTATDGMFEYVWTGSVWQALYCGLPVSPPVTGDFPTAVDAVNVLSPSLASSGGAVLLSAMAASGDNLCTRLRPIPSAPYTITVRVIPNMIWTSFESIGICWYESSSGKFITVGPGTISDAMYLRVIGWTASNNAGGGNLITQRQMHIPWTRGGALTLVLKDDNTNRSAHQSTDGINLLQMYSGGRTTFPSSSMTPDKWGIYVLPYASAIPTMLTVLDVQIT